METLTWSWIDKSSWGSGEWQDECDKMQWVDERTGLPCLAVRHESNGHWCGYVGVSESHPFYEVEYNSCAFKDVKCKDTYCGHFPESILDVHGGITFSGFCQEDDKEHGICHISPDKVFWFGFDCAHSDDYEPAYMAKYDSFIRSGVYRTLEYVKSQCESLCNQVDQISKRVS